ncbi:MAG: phosphate signaling complex protein PhoU [Actinomycetota bacterium]
MRDVFHHELDQLASGLVDMTRLVGTAISEATRALLDADLQLAESVIAADAQVDAAQTELDERAVDLLARQQPVATDLRVVVAALRMSASIERMGDLARHIAQQARLRYPRPAVPDDVAPVFARMGEVCARLAGQAGEVIRTRDLAAAAQLETDDDLLDRLHREVFAKLMSPEWPHGAEATVDVTLLSRYYERFGDHAVSVARRVVFLVTGDLTGSRPS